MLIKETLKTIYRKVNTPIFKYTHTQKEKYKCPVCKYEGPLKDKDMPTGLRKHAACPSCNALERHRIQYLVLYKVMPLLNKDAKVLHFAPEPFFKSLLKKKFQDYETADLFRKGVDHKVDLQNLPFEDETYDFIYASHVLEHIPNDKKALAEIYRVLKKPGIAILPVPIICDNTVEYSEPNPFEEYHMRAPGLDYYDRYEKIFDKVKYHKSSDTAENTYQIYVYEDRSVFPSEKCPNRPAMQGHRHIDIVPVCMKS